MTIIKNENIYTILHSEQIRKSITYHKFFTSVCNKDVALYENHGVYVCSDWCWEDDLSTEDIEIITKIVNNKRNVKVYCRFYSQKTDIIITSTNYFDDSDGCNYVWKQYDNKGILYIFNGIIVPKCKELSDYICVVKIDENHELNMETMKIKVRDDKWFDENIMPMLSEDFDIELLCE